MSDVTVSPHAVYDVRATQTSANKAIQHVRLDLGSGTSESVVSGAVPVTAASAESATVTSVAASASSTTLLAANTDRKGATIFNDSSATLRIKFGTTASSSDFTAKLVAGAYYEVPFGYVGPIDGIWESATGDARITEVS